MSKPTMVFDHIARDLAGPRLAGETEFAYRSDRPEAQRVRELVEA